MPPAIPTAHSWPLGLTAGPDGALWFIERTAGKPGRMTLRGTFREWAPAPDSVPNRIIVGPDDHVYVALFSGHQLARPDAPGRVVKTWNVPGALLVATSHRVLWLTDPSAGTVARVRITCRCSQERLSKGPTN